MQSIDELIEIFLLKYRRCPVLHVGTLSLTDTPASASLTEKVIYPPGQSVSLLPDVMDNSDLLEFISRRREISADLALQELSAFSRELKLLMVKEEKQMPSIGCFFIAPDGYLDFKSSEATFAPGIPVRAEWVIHPEASHSIRVGDKETNTTEMSAYFNERGKSKRQWGWLIPLIMALVAAGLIGYYYSRPHPSETGGNGTPISVKPVETTYSTE